eukprot:3430487-Pleurochrysis_carterae.AAC.1
MRRRLHEASRTQTRASASTRASARIGTWTCAHAAFALLLSQELVFIGVSMDQAAVTALLDECLLTDAEMEAYTKHWAEETAGPAAAQTA